jgi:hypothetical protein
MTNPLDTLLAFGGVPGLGKSAALANLPSSDTSLWIRAGGTPFSDVIAPGKTFTVRIDGIATPWVIQARGYAQVGAYIIRHPDEFDLNNATLDGIVRITSSVTNKTQYYRLRHNGAFMVLRVGDVVGIRDSALNNQNGE